MRSSMAHRGRFGLVGSIFAGFLPGALRQRTGIDGSSDLQLLALAIGAAA